MNQFSLSLWILVFAYLFYLPCFAQIKNKISKIELFAEVAKDESIVAECEQKRREYQIAQFGKIFPKITGHCWEGCPIRVVKPYYSPTAKRLNISGRIKVETIVDEEGKVIYAEVIQGQPFLSEAARRAAYLSTYMPKKSCYNKPIKFRWVIIYNFH